VFEVLLLRISVAKMVVRDDVRICNMYVYSMISFEIKG
jgi:hypothetical protein